jgi:hypothetical protein
MSGPTIATTTLPAPPALELWDEGGQLGNALAEKYLTQPVELGGRGLTELPPNVANCLCFHSKVIFGKDDADQWRLVPCLLALVRNADPVQAATPRASAAISVLFEPQRTFDTGHN